MCRVFCQLQCAWHVAAGIASCRAPAASLSQQSAVLSASICCSEWQVLAYASLQKQHHDI